MLTRFTLASVLLLILMLPSVAWAGHSAPKIVLLGQDEDLFYNWDFRSENVSLSNVDWPVSVVHWNEAEINLVKDRFWGQATCPPVCDSMHARLNDTGGSFDYQWDSDRGTKDPPEPQCPGDNWHMRVYADNDDSLKNLTWGYYVLGTTHRDRDEACLSTEHGWSEETEDHVISVANSSGYPTQSDVLWFDNQDGPRWAGEDYVNNNGWASKVKSASHQRVSWAREER